jgi:hypothetical protein
MIELDTLLAIRRDRLPDLILPERVLDSRQANCRQRLSGGIANINLETAVRGDVKQAEGWAEGI